MLDNRNDTQNGQRRVKNLDDALKLVDESNLSPPPAYERKLSPIESNSLEQGFDSVADTEILKTEKPGFISKFFARLKSEDKDDLPVRMHVKDDNLDIGPTDFKMKFDFESAYRDPTEDKPLRRRREKRTGLVGGLLLATFIICVSLTLATIAWMFTMDVLGFGSVDEAVNVTIPVDFTIDTVADILYESGVIRHRPIFLLYAEFSDAHERIVPGSFVLNRNFDYRAIVQGMTPRAGVRVETTVTIPEGFTISQIFDLLEREEVTPAADLWEAATNHDFNFPFLDSATLGNRLRLEGFLFPETYNFFKGSNPVQVINRMLREFNRRFVEEYYERAEELGYSVHDIITIASMIEREAANDAERANIASVIYNRLDRPSTFPFLQIDAVIHYAIQGTAIPFSLRVESEFNTHTNPGLPPGPIANPGMPSIRAALFPSNTNYVFYALNINGAHNFFTNYDDHRNFTLSDQFARAHAG